MAPDQRRYGTKRPAENDLSEDQPLAKRLGRLHLGPHSTDSNARPPSSPSEGAPSGDPASQMLLDDTKYTIYVHDLDREIADIESQESCVSFLPHIAEKLAPIPQSILSPPRPQGNELVLYREPSSLTVSEEQDSVRRAVMESRARSRKSWNENRDSRSSPSRSLSREDAARDMGTNEHERHDDDAMDIDEEL
ncbi:hypothetical protein PHISP_01481 [Aspergillus sp. HF37]|nr:hypothetical protein PHISP_01481 [Aspergillus sp. HF37]